MVQVDSRNGIWFWGLLVLFVLVAFCAAGYYQSYKINCFGGSRVWVWTKIPPQYECSVGF